jgi:riboflavin synthase
MGSLAGKKGSTLEIKANKTLLGSSVGDSVAVNGVCLTITKLNRASFTVDISPETIRCTNLNEIALEAVVDLERPLAYGGRIGGHMVQGHVDEKGVITSITPEEESLVFEFTITKKAMRYVIEKGFIAVDGISLTVVARTTSSFSVSVIPYTRDSTVLGALEIGDKVNIEVDMNAKYIESFTTGGGL